MRIAVIGTHCTGKTSLCDRLYSSLWFEDYKFTREPIREVFSMGFRVNEAADDASQLAMVSLHLNNLLSKKLVSDRSLLDAYVYAKYIHEKNKNVTKETLDFIKHITDVNLPRYDLLILCSPEFKPTEDGFRSVDAVFRDCIHQMFLEEIERRQIPVLKVTGNTEERYKQVMNKVVY